MIYPPLSELSRGKGERRGSAVQVVYEDRVRILNKTRY